ncbi:right-handed parallel beta-helix repeat-containing protein [Klebsiella quasipneumoniae]|uniref:right-handed parallel beta-helix repeat-containing protein n=2 Tax=Klebsiella quasipneumoniae TaxID=1463165 RepID=UPI001EF841E9|nr:right-handed parallel beta-helix repeat-containing protein [Klebsiella quasipneumoniae]ULJ34485.1 right-handed parallel beta-helix repeat-containing protein [Klebsiella quasipneumoniae]
MSEYDTGNPVPSASIPDAWDNMQSIDRFANSSDETITTRTGKQLDTLHGINVKADSQRTEQQDSFELSQSERASSFEEKTNEFESRFSSQLSTQESTFSESQTDKENRFQQFLLSSGYVFLGDYENGPFQFSARNQYIRYNNQYYRLNAATDVGFTTTGTDATSFANDVTHFVLMDGDTLRQNLGSGDGIKWIGGLGYTTPEKYLARGDGVTDDTAALQLAIFEAKMSGREVLLSSMYLISDGFKLDSSVTIRGTGKKSGFVTSDSITSQRILLHITADNVTLENFSVLTSADGFGAVGSVGCYAVRVVDNVERTRICGLNIDGRHYGAMGFCVGISISWSNHGFYQNNNIQNCSVGFHGGGSFNVIDGNICDNHFVDDPDNFTNEWDSTSMYWDGFMFEGLKYSAITNNTATNNGQSGIYFGGGGSSVSCYNIISGNIANWNFNHGIDNGVSGTQSATNDVYGNTINGNICKNNRYNGIWLGTVHDIVVNSNIVVIDEEHKAKFNSTGDSSGIGLRLNTTKNCVVSDNDVFVTANEFSSIYFRGVGNVLGDNRIRGKDIIVENLITNNSAKGLTGTFKPTIAVGSGVTLDSTATRGTYSINNNKIVYDLDLNITTSSAKGPLQLSGFPFLASGTIYQYLGQCQFTSGMKTGFYQGNIGVNVYVNNSVVTIAALVTGVATDIGTYLGDTVRMRIKVEVIMNAADFEGTFN